MAGKVQKEELIFCIFLLPTLRSEHTYDLLLFIFNLKLGRNGKEVSWGEKG